MKKELGYHIISFGGYLSHESNAHFSNIPHVSGFRWPVVQLYTPTSFGLHQVKFHCETIDQNIKKEKKRMLVLQSSEQNKAKKKINRE